MKDLAGPVSEKNQKQMLWFLLRPKMRQVTPLNATRLGDGWREFDTDRHRERERDRDRQTDRQRQRQTDRQTDRQKDADRKLL